MTKAEIVNEVAKSTGIEKVQVQSVIEEFTKVVKDSIIAGQPVYLRGFGSFIIKHRAEKAARNITKKQTMTIPAHNIPAFKPAKVFVNAGKEKQSIHKIINLLVLCLAVRKERDIKWRRTSVKSACARTDTRRSKSYFFAASAILAVC